MESEETYRYSRQTALKEIGEDGQLKLSKASVLIIGIGGLGCPVAQYLAGAGTGRIGLADFDRVEEHNLHRQVLFGQSDIGKNKAQAAATHLQELNHLVKYEVHTKGCTPETAESLISSYDIVVDGTDNYATRYLINDWCGYFQKPLVYGGVFGFEGQVSVFHQQPGFDYRTVFPEPPQREGANCSLTGVLGLVPGMVGLQQAHEVIKLIVGHAPTLSGKLWVLDTRSGETHTWKLSPLKRDYSQKPGKETVFEEIDPTQFQQRIADSWVICDVREHDELIANPFTSHLHIPLSQWPERVGELQSKDQVLFVCQKGKRSLGALQDWLTRYPGKQGASLRGGLESQKELTLEIPSS